MTERDATNASERERKSAMAERSATKLTKTNFISTRLGSLFNVRVSAIHPSGIHVEIETPFIEGFLPLTSVVDDFYLYTSPFHPLIGKRTKRRIFIGTELQVILTELDWKNLTPVFCWISWKR
jgi:ribonuclease R